MRNRLALFVLLLALLAFAAPARAQIIVPNTFVPDAVALSELINENFNRIGSDALNRTGGSLTGSLTVQLDVTIDGVDISSMLTPTLVTVPALTVNGAALFNAPVMIASTAAAALDVAGGIQAGSGNVPIVGADGRIPEISATYFASLSGANLTSIPETAIVDGALLARVASPETISGFWLFSSAPTLANNVALNANTPGASLARLATLDSANQPTFGPTDAQITALCCNSTYLTGSVVTVRANGVDRTTWGQNGTLTHSAALVLSGTISASLGGVSQNDWAPAGHTGAYQWDLSTGGGTPSITGIAGGVNGRKILLTLVSGTAVNLPNDSALSAATNRILTPAGSTYTLGSNQVNAIELVYNGTLSRWVVIGK